MQRKQESGKTEYKPSGKGWEQKGDDLKPACVVWTLVCLTCMAVMLTFAANKSIVIADVSQDPSSLPVNSTQQGVTEEQTLVLEENGKMEGAFRVPLPKGIRAENVTMENRYIDRELYLYIGGGDEAFYAENHIDGDVTPMLSAQCEVQEGGILLKMKMNRVLEYRSTMDSSGLTINWYEPGELYDYIVVLDPAWGGSEAGIAGYGLPEKEVTLQVARQIQKQFELQGVRLYCTRTEDVDMSLEERALLAEETGADFYIRLCAGEDGTDEEAHGITGFYNEDYYIPGFGSIDLADLLTREVTIASSNRAVGLKAAEEGSMLKLLKVPAAEISLGMLSNPKEAYLLGQENYQEKLAAGFLSAISQAVEMLEAAEE